MKIKFIGHSYHQTTKSSKFFIELLERIGQISYLWDESWTNPDKKLDLSNLDDHDMIVVWQMPHVAMGLPESIRHKSVYAPMHDAVCTLGSKSWRKLRGLRLLCFSVHDHVRALSNHIESFYWNYYPDEQPPYIAADPSELKLFFWQRRQNPNWRSLCGKIPMTQFSSVHLHTALDPGLGKLVRPLDSEIEQYKITTSAWFEDKNQYLETLARHNVFVAPRKQEGIGMALLEALGAGMVCIANDAPTMNEYIIDGVNGYLTHDSSSTETIAITDAKAMSAWARHYFQKGMTNSRRQKSDLLQYLKKSSEPPYHKVAGPIKHKLSALMPQRIDVPTLARQAADFAQRVTRGKPKISIVTVVKDNAAGLSRTFASVFAQTYLDVEYVVMDGQSKDDTLMLIERCKVGIHRFVSQSDSGPYDAMNKSLAHCRGDYVIFMNSGDEFHDRHALASALEGAPDDVDFIYGHHFYIRREHKWEARNANDLRQTYLKLVEGDLSPQWLSGIPCHQSTITSVDFLKRRPYDWQTFRIAADHDVMFDAMAQGSRAYHTNSFISRYHGGGMSAKQGKLCRDNWHGIALKHTQDPVAIKEFYGHS